MDFVNCDKSELFSYEYMMSLRNEIEELKHDNAKLIKDINSLTTKHREEINIIHESVKNIKKQYSWMVNKHQRMKNNNNLTTKMSSFNTLSHEDDYF